MPRKEDKVQRIAWMAAGAYAFAVGGLAWRKYKNHREWQEYTRNSQIAAEVLRLQTASALPLSAAIEQAVAQADAEPGPVRRLAESIRDKVTRKKPAKRPALAEGGEISERFSMLEIDDDEDKDDNGNHEG